MFFFYGGLALFVLFLCYMCLLQFSHDKIRELLKAYIMYGIY